ncbi:hypothetical protein K470DRAFT_67749 [Piedraia hortae CBS 480.64]|uniref:CCHC-type domain-containing protein n=1 Tax=Piedraia hortae CBS 480.64 TaxID=1314780 RepID=A0A6A7BZJ1_9PEZI|nr:hypothetical protein K470DRAFT_67749 [Piedraia hortae CBS 480.64]
MADPLSPSNLLHSGLWTLAYLKDDPKILETALKANPQRVIELYEEALTAASLRCSGCSLGKAKKVHKPRHHDGSRRTRRSRSNRQPTRSDREPSHKGQATLVQATTSNANRLIGTATNQPTGMDALAALPASSSNQIINCQSKKFRALDRISRKRHADGRITREASRARVALQRCVRCNTHGHMADNCLQRQHAVPDRRLISGGASYQNTSMQNNEAMQKIQREQGGKQWQPSSLLSSAIPAFKR